MSSYPALKGLLQSSQNHTWNTADSVGRGATAVVYLGRHKETGQVVAVKVFHDHLRYGQCGEDLPELAILRRLKHDNIIALHAIEQEVQSKRTLLVMEYCEGGSLMSMLDQPQYRYGLPQIQMLLVLQHVAAGIQYLRQSGIVHRDIKPANIMRALTEDGSSIYKLTDFGAARRLDEDENFASMYGTEEYLHPGMYKKGVMRVPTGQRFDASVDLWSLGVTFYHVATGQLPFQPHGGRSNKETMYQIISKKESGVISGQQHFEGGPILWSRHLPATCLLSSGMKQELTPLLAGLMEANPGKMLSYEDLFSSVHRLNILVQFSVFHYTHSALHTVLLEPSHTLSDLQNAVTSLTDQPVSQQLLLAGGHCLGDIVDPKTPVSCYPSHLKDCTIYLFPRDAVLTQPPSLHAPEIPPFPEFLNMIDVNKDTSLAANCLTRGHLIHQHTHRVLQQQQCIVEGHLLLRLYLDKRVRAVGEVLQVIQQLVTESKKRFSTFYSSLKSMQTLLTALGQQLDTYFRDVLKDETLIKVERKMEERVEEIAVYHQGLQDRLTEAQLHAAQWSPLCQHSSCASKVEHQLTLITQTQARFRRDKTVKNSLTSHDENIHRLERQKLQETCMRMLSILTGHCVPARDRLHKQAFQFTGLLVKALGRLGKVEKNNESVINCQQLLSARLDRLEVKVLEEVDHLQKQLTKVNPTPPLPPPTQFVELQKKSDTQLHQGSHVDEGMGTSMLESRSSWTKNMSSAPSLSPGSSRTSVEPSSLQNSLQSLRQESEEVLSLVMENTDLMKRLDRENMTMSSGGSLSRIAEEPS